MTIPPFFGRLKIFGAVSENETSVIIFHDEFSWQARVADSNNNNNNAGQDRTAEVEVRVLNE